MSGPVNTSGSLLSDSEKNTDLDHCEVSKGEEKRFQPAEVNLRRSTWEKSLPAHLKNYVS